MEEKRTKIICTVGPASSGLAVLVRMLRAGMDVARLNFSHGTHEQHAKLLRTIRAAARKAGKTVAVLQDLQGPKIRVGDLPPEGVALHKGERIYLTTANVAYEPQGAIPLTYRALHKDVHAGHRIFFDDGSMEVEVERIRGRVITARVKVPGVLRSHKGLNVPDSTVEADPFTEKDRDDLMFGVAQGVDWVVLSFVASADDMVTARKVAAAAARAAGVRPPKLMAKVERRSAIEHFDEILEASDGILLGRGDLGVEVPPEEVPVMQKDIVDACRRAGKPVVVATQMLNSMVENPRSTRAETSDVANAVFDHADAVMLSAESATGRYPSVAVQAMAAVIREAEKSRYDEIRHVTLHTPDLAASLAQTAHVLAASGLIDAVVCVAAHGALARKANMFRPSVPIIMVAPDDALARQSVLGSGIVPLVLSDEPATFLPRLLTKIRREGLLPRRARIAVLQDTGSTATLTVVK